MLLEISGVGPLLEQWQASHITNKQRTQSFESRVKELKEWVECNGGVLPWRVDEIVERRLSSFIAEQGKLFQKGRLLQDKKVALLEVPGMQKRFEFI